MDILYLLTVEAGNDADADIAGRAGRVNALFLRIDRFQCGRLPLIQYSLEMEVLGRHGDEYRVRWMDMWLIARSVLKRCVSFAYSKFAGLTRGMT